MEYVVFGRWQLETEREATRRAYAHLEAGGPERCGCAHCRNFAAARMEVYPVKVHRLFEDLGIDFTKEAEVYHMVRLRPGLHQYGGWFHCVGRVESETEEAGQTAGRVLTVATTRPRWSAKCKCETP